jgi:hypothetical protein
MAAMYADEAVEAVEGVEEQAVRVGPVGPHVITTMESMGIAASDIKKLQEAGIHTIEGLSHAPMKRLTAIKGMTEQKIKKLRDAGARPAHWALAGARAVWLDSPHWVVPHSQGDSAGRLHDRQLHRAAAAQYRVHHHRLRGAGRTAGRCARARARHCFCTFIAAPGRVPTAPTAPPRAAQAALSPAPSPRFTASSALARRRSATCSPSPARRGGETWPTRCAWVPAFFVCFRGRT